MATYTFYAVQTVRLENETEIEAASLQDAMAEWAQRSQVPEALTWGRDPYGELPTAILVAILKDGERLSAVEAIMVGPQDTGWHGYGGQFELDQRPKELVTVRELTVVKG